MTRLRVFTSALAVLTVLATSAAMADPGKGKGNGHGKDKDEAVRVVVINDNDRSRIRDFLVDQRAKDCPPGLAKKHNGCLPPGQAKKHYVGEILTIERPRTIWQALADMISPPPQGYRYVRSDREVLLVDTGNRVVDIVEID